VDLRLVCSVRAVVLEYRMMRNEELLMEFEVEEEERREEGEGGKGSGLNRWLRYGFWK
jgi:hypothetical protein